MTKTRIIFIIVLLLLIVGFFAFDFQKYFTLQILKSKHESLLSFYHQHPMLTISIYLLVYIATTTLSLPGASILTLAGGGIFGLWQGVLIVSFASTIGATLAFLSARFLFRETVKKKFGDRLAIIDAGLAKDGAFYLFTLRLIPLIPFFIINLVMGLTNMKVGMFYLVSQIGMLAGTIVYVNAGTQLANLDSLSGILSPTLIASFILLGLFPIITKKIIAMIEDKKSKLKNKSNWQKPKKFDTNIVVIGAGSAGLVTAYLSAAVKAKVTLIEKNKMGGDCLNTGCVPSKALIRSGKFLSHVRRAKEFGIHKAEVEFDFAQIMERVQNIIKTVEPHDSIERFTKLGVNIIIGSAKIITPWEVAVTTASGVKSIKTRAIVIAAGARPFVPDIPGLNDVGFKTSDNIWDLRIKPKRLLIIGGGPIGCELAQAFSRFDIEVTQIEGSSRIMKREDADVSEIVTARFRKEGINVLLEHTAKNFFVEKGEKILVATHNEKEIRIGFDEVLLAIGRVANISGYGVEEMGIIVSDKKTIAINAFQETNYPNIYACGDVSGPYQFTHTAAHQAWFVTANALFGCFKKFKTDNSIIPWSTFIEPEVARVGLNEQEAKSQLIPYELSIFKIDELDRAIADSEAHGFVKVLTVPNKDKILGVTIVGEHAGDLIAEFVLAMKHGLGLNKILGTIHIYPTMAEANKYAAGVWKKNHQPKFLLSWIEYFHTWRRG